MSIGTWCGKCRVFHAFECRNTAPEQAMTPPDDVREKVARAILAARWGEEEADVMLDPPPIATKDDLATIKEQFELAQKLADAAIAAYVEAMKAKEDAMWEAFAQNAENMVNSCPGPERDYYKNRIGWKYACCEFARQARDPDFRLALLKGPGHD